MTTITASSQSSPSQSYNPWWLEDKALKISSNPQNVKQDIKAFAPYTGKQFSESAPMHLQYLIGVAYIRDLSIEDKYVNAVRLYFNEARAQAKLGAFKSFRADHFSHRQDQLGIQAKAQGGKLNFSELVSILDKIYPHRKQLTNRLQAIVK